MEGESMSEWKAVKLGDLVTIKYGKDHKSLSDGVFPVFGSGGLMRKVDTYIYDKPSLLIPRKGTLNNIIYTEERFWTVDTMFWTKVDELQTSAKFLYYYLKDFNFNALNVGSAVPSLTVPILNDIDIKLPSTDKQSDIVGILSSLDAKIETNNKLNEKLEEMAQAIFKSWFVDFEPFKDKPFHETELGMIPEGWEVGSILDIAELFDSQRKPLSSMEREYMKGKYPYYGATSIMDYIDKYIFDGTYLLMGEDGSVVKENGNPYLQYVWGKFWPNNHAHVMQGRNGYSTEMLYCLLSITDVSSIVTGAVQMKISQRSMSRLLTVIPSKSVCKNFNTIIRPIFDIIKRIKEENDRLASLRDTLLPRLMSGEIKI